MSSSSSSGSGITFIPLVLSDPDTVTPDDDSKRDTDATLDPDCDCALKRTQPWVSSPRSGLWTYPSFGEKWSSFMSDAQPEAFVTEIERLLDEARILHARCNERASLRAMCWPQGRALSFRIRVFKDPWETGHPFVIEFQKREGCSLAFHRTYRVLRSRLTPPFDVGPLPSSPSGPPPAAKASDASVQSESTKAKRPLAIEVRFAWSGHGELGLHRPAPDIKNIEPLWKMLEHEGDQLRNYAILALLEWAQSHPKELIHTMTEHTFTKWCEHITYGLEDMADLEATHARIVLLRELLQTDSRILESLNIATLTGQLRKVIRGPIEPDNMAHVGVRNEAEQLLHVLDRAKEGHAI